jgi:hypothetical protein
MRVLSMLAALATVSCSAAATNDNALPTTGTWGGPDVQVTVTSQGTTTQFVCAHGTIDQLIAPDANGNFSATGTYVFEHPATVVGQPSSDSHSARYDGQLSARTLQISVTVPDKQQVFGPFTATLGATGPSTRCQ